MAKNNFLQSFIRLIRGSDLVEARTANDTAECRQALMKALSPKEYSNLDPQYDALDPSKRVHDGVDPAFWGDVLLRKGSGDDIRSFPGKFLDRLSRQDFMRPSDAMMRALEISHSNDDVWKAQVDRIAAALEVGIKFDEKAREFAAPKFWVSRDDQTPPLPPYESKLVGVIEALTKALENRKAATTASSLTSHS